MTAMLKQQPSAVLEGIHKVLLNFQMPGVAMPNFVRRSVDVAKAGVYNLRIHHDRVVLPVLKDWKIADLRGLTHAAAELQEKILALPDQIMERAERFEQRMGMFPA